MKYTNTLLGSLLFTHPMSSEGADRAINRSKENPKLCCQANDNVRIRYRLGGSPVGIFAIHGGRIEPGTSKVALALAHPNHTVYVFEGIRASHNRIFHIPSTRFHEPIAMKMIRYCDTIITVHGYRGEEESVLVGGRDLALTEKFRRALKHAGFIIGKDNEGLRGENPDNICNKGRHGKGIQLELSWKLRRSMLRDSAQGILQEPTSLFHAFVDAIKSAIG